MNATEINQRLAEINILMNFILQKLHDLKNQQGLNNI
jgi:hypothetical protein